MTWFESLNGPKERVKSIAERAEDELDIRQHVDIANGVIYTSKPGLKAMLYYRDYGWDRQPRKTRESKTNVIVINNPRKRYEIS